jgi:hypothetical protein
MDVKIKIYKDGKTYYGQLDIDGDIFTSFPLLDCSTRIESQEDGSSFYVTETYDLFTNCKEVKIETVN